jgi:hypothetical protein
MKVVVAIALACLGLAGALGDGAGPALWNQPCDLATKQCPVTTPEQAGLPPLVGSVAASSHPLQPLRPYLPSGVYDTLDGLLPGTPSVPLPARPTNVTVHESVNENVHVHEGKANEHVHVHRDAEATVLPATPPAEEGQVPCADERGCPDLVVDASRLLVGTMETRAFAPDHCAVQEGSTQPGERRLLRFTFTSVNVGDGDLRIGQPDQHPEWFEWGACHGHWHFRRYAEYRLWTPEGYRQWQDLRQAHPDETSADLLADNPDVAATVLGHKQGFCAMDVWPYAPVDPQKYTSCFSVQGISRGWADEYGFQLDGQWIDVTGLPAGAYVLEGEANPTHLYRELDYSNNSGAVLVAVPPA